jgi:hypothetical protein
MCESKLIGSIAYGWIPSIWMTRVFMQGGGGVGGGGVAAMLDTRRRFINFRQPGPQPSFSRKRADALPFS